MGMHVKIIKKCFSRHKTAVTQNPRGFTLTELMLAMAFLTFVLLFVVIALLQYMSTYNKGLVYKEINQAGRTIFEEVTRSVRSSSANIRFMDEGRLCVGGQTYVWSTREITNAYVEGGDIEGIIRVPDSTGNLCSDSGGTPPNIPQTGEVIIARPNVAVQSFSAQSGDDGRLYSLNLVLSTSDDNVPPSGSLECPPGREGEFCAVASFDTNISTRK